NMLGTHRDRGTPHDAAPPTPPGIRVTYLGGSTGLSFNAQCRCEAGRESRKRDCAVPSEVPGVLTCARSPSANRRQPTEGSYETPLRRNSLKRLGPFFHCRQRYIRSLRRIHASRLVSTRGV